MHLPNTGYFLYNFKFLLAMKNHKVIKFLLPSQQLEEIKEYVVNFYSETWSKDYGALKKEVDREFQKMPKDISGQLNDQEGHLCFVPDHKNLKLKIQVSLNAPAEAAQIRV
jgi:hypothetical protein